MQKKNYEIDDVITMLKADILNNLPEEVIDSGFEYYDISNVSIESQSEGEVSGDFDIELQDDEDDDYSAHCTYHIKDNVVEIECNEIEMM